MAQNAALDSLSDLLSRSHSDSNKVELLLQLGNEYRSVNLDKCLEYGEKAAGLSQEIGFRQGHAQALKLIGLVHYFRGNLADALIQWQEAETSYRAADDTIGLANILSNMGAIYFNQSQYSKAIDLYLKSLSLAEITKDTMRIGTVLQNIGAVHLEKHDHDLALQAYQKVIPLFKAIGYDEGIGLAYLNIGEVHRARGDLENAISNLKLARGYLTATPYYTTLLRTIGEALVSSSEFKEGMAYLDSAYQVASASGDQFELIRSINAMATAHEVNGDDVQALSHYERAKSMLMDAESENYELQISAMGLVRLYAKKNDFQRAFENQQLLQSINDSIYNLESDKKIDQLLFNFELEKKEGKIALLVKDQEIQTIELDRQKGIRNGFVGGFVLVLLFAGVFFAQRNRISREKQRSEELLLNILPEEVAEELKAKGSAEAVQIDHATVLFTDFKGFTAMSEQLSPKELVKDLHECFSAFDHICEKHGIEKIKTIGDAYMAPGGLPTPNSTHAPDVVKAALEMAQVVEEGKAKKIAA
ncbi:MAG: tetratricopeptide repeat protein, partial [Flavobacteriales bacterium]|nr:tetratricopeptide repeat protein [Flavobacteriales bacterium]